MVPQAFGIASQIPGLQPFPVLVPPLPGAGNFDVELILKSDLPVEQLTLLSEQILSEANASGMFLFVDTDLKVDLPQAQVVVNNTHPTRAVQTVQRDKNDEIVSTTTTYEVAK
jgi:multidrug efflux pump